ncbi:uncharacterized protein CLAFUR5_05680 [Fulvia fulva]|uniref:Uncharacterized protein n=1 Tax=Passalora fulva TaxID=5499 RepID=A0A9Q8LJ79_PASFU|nr:uncharacterized protein CLAFUR5_05680 [Fulvia fulva]KAK4624912.1 hypothetical protein CLAFUR0_05541 [Fulvia fulva]UJO18385.1 hypothetical protein CLAFUR5_05680 [Fulvia fulva]
MFATQLEQTIVNLICYYGDFGPIDAKDVKESWIQLLLCLNIFDYKGYPLCRFWTDDECSETEHQWRHNGSKRCCHYLKIEDNEKLSRAFRQFYIDASDPLIERRADSALLDAIVTFAAQGCCVEHKKSKKCMAILAEELLPVVKKWRRQYVFCEPPEPALIGEAVEVDPPGRVSGIFGRRRYKKLSKKHQRSRSVSPSSDEESFDVSPVPGKPPRPVSSAHDILMTPRHHASTASDWNVNDRGRSRKAHLASISVRTQAFLKSTGLNTGRSANTKVKTWITGRPLSTIQAGGSHDSMTHRVPTSARID